MNLLTLQNSMLPPSERVKNQTDKSATGPYNRKKLLQWLEEKAKSEKDWELYKPYIKTKIICKKRVTCKKKQGDFNFGL
jgi:tropomodulin